MTEKWGRSSEKVARYLNEKIFKLNYYKGLLHSDLYPEKNFKNFREGTRMGQKLFSPRLFFKIFTAGAQKQEFVAVFQKKTNFAILELKFQQKWYNGVPWCRRLRLKFFLKF